jgi:hypothetical protein
LLEKKIFKKILQKIMIFGEVFFENKIPSHQQKNHHNKLQHKFQKAT